jgi:3-hydroxyacyl-[acyl-carrier-protein] dehydratase
MRWIWIDRFTEFESGRRATAIKNVTLAEDHLHDHFPAYPLMPNSLITEGLAQTGGLLVGEFNRFEKNVILAKIPKAKFHFGVVPGDTLIYTAEIIGEVTDSGAMVSATSRVGDRLQAEMEILFAHVTGAQADETVFERDSFVFTMGLLGVFDVGGTSTAAKRSES